MISIHFLKQWQMIFLVNFCKNGDFHKSQTPKDEENMFFRTSDGWRVSLSRPKRKTNEIYIKGVKP